MRAACGLGLCGRIEAQHDPRDFIPGRIRAGGIDEPQICYKMRSIVISQLRIRRRGLSNRWMGFGGQRFAVPATADSRFGDLSNVWNNLLPPTRARSQRVYSWPVESGSGRMTPGRTTAPARPVAAVCRVYSVVEYSTTPCCLVNGDTRGTGAQSEEASAGT